ncbi:MAG: type II toxin-antitoxin system VapC family toxin [Deltaproteobacteria bacterium]|nr:MAG: type II toxin-antitoxin system VapC family toxin [Deltaproteobacteria bacterium]
MRGTSSVARLASHATGVGVADDLRWTIDTAPLLTYLAGSPQVLPRRARRALEAARAGRGRIGVCTVSLFEVALLAERGCVTLGRPFDAWCDLLERTPGLGLLPLERPHISEARALPLLRDPFDRLIAGTALALGLPLITPDRRIAGAGRLKIVW